MLESRLQTCLNIPREGGSGSNGDGELSLVSSNQLVEALNNTLCLCQPSVIRKHDEQVLGDVRDRLLARARVQHVQSGGTVLRGQGRVGDKGLEIRRALDGRGNGVELGLDLVQGLR